MCPQLFASSNLAQHKREYRSESVQLFLAQGSLDKMDPSQHSDKESEHVSMPDLVDSGNLLPLDKGGRQHLMNPLDASKACATGGEIQVWRVSGRHPPLFCGLSWRRGASESRLRQHTPPLLINC